MLFRSEAVVRLIRSERRVDIRRALRLEICDKCCGELIDALRPPLQGLEDLRCRLVQEVRFPGKRIENHQLRAEAGHAQIEMVGELPARPGRRCRGDHVSSGSDVRRLDRRPAGLGDALAAAGLPGMSDDVPGHRRRSRPGFPLCGLSSRAIARGVKGLLGAQPAIALAHSPVGGLVCADEILAVELLLLVVRVDLELVQVAFHPQPFVAGVMV